MGLSHCKELLPALHGLSACSAFNACDLWASQGSRLAGNPDC